MRKEEFACYCMTPEGKLTFTEYATVAEADAAARNEAKTENYEFVTVTHASLGLLGQFVRS